MAAFRCNAAASRGLTEIQVLQYSTIIEYCYAITKKILNFKN